MIRLTLLLVFVSIVASNYHDNCSGSTRCHKDMKQDCQNAFNRYTDTTVYAAFTSRVDGDCTAIYRCNKGYVPMTGAQLKTEFQEIYAGQDCKDCGSHAFDNGNCQVTLNFCSKCYDSGQANATLLEVLMK